MSAPLLPLWHVSEGVSFFAGSLGRHLPHAHCVPVLLAGLYDTFEIGFGASRSVTRAAVVPAGVAYELEAHDAPIGVIYLEPTAGSLSDLIQLLQGRSTVAEAMVGSSATIPHLRGLYESHSASEWAAEALDDMVFAARLRPVPALDARLLEVLKALAVGDCACDAPTLSARDAAGRLGMSLSRFQYLFTRDTGVPFRRYRTWQRLKLAIREIVDGESQAGAAYLAGFADQPHFSRAFHHVFGAPPSRTLTAVRTRDRRRMR